MREKWERLKIFLKTPHPKRTVTVATLFLMLLALPLTVVVSQQQQNTRQEAAGTCKTGVNSFSVNTPCPGGFRYVAYSCYDGYGTTSGSSSSCKSSSKWRNYAEQQCAGRSSCGPIIASPTPVNPIEVSPIEKGPCIEKDLKCEGSKVLTCSKGVWTYSYLCSSGTVCEKYGPSQVRCVGTIQEDTPLTPTPIAEKEVCTTNGHQRCGGSYKNGFQQCNNRSWTNYSCPPDYSCKIVGANDVSCVASTGGVSPTPPPPTSTPKPAPPAPTTYNPGTYYCNLGGATGYSYRNGATGVCTNGTYTGFYHSPTCTTNSTKLGQAVLIQPCNYTYYSSANCTGSVVGYHQCTSRTVTSN